MEYIKLGHSDVKISKITFGAWAIGGWMWGGNDENDAIRAIEKSIDLGMTSIDTAPIYGFGYSEELVGKVTENKRDKVEILTKYCMRWNSKQGVFYFNSTDLDGKPVDIYTFGGKDSVIKECEDSLRRLRTDYIDLYQMHWPDTSTPIEETMEAIELLLEQGKIKAAGVSNFSKELLERTNKKVMQASNQVPYSMVLRDIEKELVPYCLENDIAILAYSPLQRGLLTGKITKNYPFKKGDHRPGTPHFKAGNIKRVNTFLDQIRPIAAGYDASLAQLVLNWTIQQPGITSALAGARNAKQVEENAGALNFNLTGEEINTINGYLDQLDLEL